MTTPTADGPPPVILEDPPKITRLTGDEQPPDPPTLAALLWLLRRYSSYTYIHRCGELLRMVVQGFDAGALGLGGSAPTLRDASRSLHGTMSRIDRGLAEIAGGQRTVGYATLLTAMNFHDDLTDPRAERGVTLRGLAAQLGADAPLTVAAARAADMALRIRNTLAGAWAVETILSDRPSLRLRPRRVPPGLPPMPAPKSDAPEVASYREVEQTGVYAPLTARAGCPNLLIAGLEAPDLTRALVRYDYAAWPGSELDEPRDAWTDYEYTEEPTNWRLLWEDHRYRDGYIPDESEERYLDEDNALPGREGADA